MIHEWYIQYITVLSLKSLSGMFDTDLQHQSKHSMICLVNTNIVRKILYWEHSVIFSRIYSCLIYSQSRIFFRENTLLLTNLVNMVEANSKFGPFGAKMRKFHLFDVKIVTLVYINQLKNLRRIVQEGFIDDWNLLSSSTVY